MLERQSYSGEDMEPSLRSIMRRSENSRWLSTHYSELAKNYDNQWVAVYDGRIVAHGKGLAKMSKQLRRDNKELHGEIAYEYVTKKPVELIL